LAVAAVPLFTRTHSNRIQISVDFTPNRLKREGKDCTETPEIRLLGLIRTKDGTLVKRFSDLTSRGFDFRFEASSLLMPDAEGATVSCVLAGPSYEAQIYLAPGEYYLQVALMDGKKFGRAEVPLIADSYDGNHLTLSEIALAKRYREVPVGAHEVPTEMPGNYIPLVSKGAEITPTANARFNKTAPLYFYFEVYEPQSDGPPALVVEAHLRILDVNTGEIKKDLAPVDATPYTKPGDPIIPIGGGIDISNLPSGSYRLEAQATDSAGETTPWRSTNFLLQ
jgi:hypothetical protein